MRLEGKLLVAAAALAVSAQARAHELACQRDLGIVEVDEAGRVVLGPDGLPVFAREPAPVLTVDHYPTTLGVRLRAINLADAPSRVTDWFDSLHFVDLPWTLHGLPTFSGVDVPVGATAEAVAVVSLPDLRSCFALTGLVSVERMGGRSCDGRDVDGRFIVRHDAGTAECRSRLVCAGDVTLQVEKRGTGSGTVTSDPPGIACGETCAAAFPVGTSVTLRGAADAGSRIGLWEGACFPFPPCTLWLYSNTTVSARFDPLPVFTHDFVEFPLDAEGLVLEDVNASGLVLGSIVPAGSHDGERPFLWRPGTGEVTFIDPGLAAHALALDDRGRALLADATLGYWVYEEGALRPVLPSPLVRPADLGNQGWIVGENLGETAADSRAFLLDGDTFTLLGPGGATAVNGAGVIVGASPAGAAIFTRDAGPIDLGFGAGSVATEVTEGGLVYGGIAEPFSAYWTSGFIRDLATGETTVIEPPAPGATLRIWSGNDRREALVTGSEWEWPMLWSGGRFTPVADLADIPWLIREAFVINARGQLIVNGLRRNAAGAWVPAGAILTPKP